MFLHLCSSNPLFLRHWIRETRDVRFHKSWSSWSQRHCPHSPFGLYVWVPYHFVSHPGPRNDQWLGANLLAYFASLTEFAIHNSLFPFSHHTMSLPTDMKMIRPWTSSGSHYFSHHVLNLSEDLQCSESWEIFHSNSIGAPSIRSNSLYWSEFWSQSIFSFQALTGFWPIHNTESDPWVFAFDNWTAFFSKQSCPLPSLLLPVDHV